MTDAPVRQLTPRQRQVADAIGRGLSYAQIGLELSISKETVRNYVKAIALKFPATPEGHITPRDLIARWVLRRKWEAERRQTA